MVRNWTSIKADIRPPPPWLFDAEPMQHHGHPSISVIIPVDNRRSLASRLRSRAGQPCTGPDLRASRWAVVGPRNRTNKALKPAGGRGLPHGGCATAGGRQAIGRLSARSACRRVGQLPVGFADLRDAAGRWRAAVLALEPAPVLRQRPRLRVAAPSRGWEAAAGGLRPPPPRLPSRRVTCQHPCIDSAAGRCTRAASTDSRDHRSHRGHRRTLFPFCPPPPTQPPNGPLSLHWQKDNVDRFRRRRERRRDSRSGGVVSVTARADVMGGILLDSLRSGGRLGETRLQVLF